MGNIRFEACFRLVPIVEITAWYPAALLVEMLRIVTNDFFAGFMPNPDVDGFLSHDALLVEVDPTYARPTWNTLHRLSFSRQFLFSRTQDEAGDGGLGKTLSSKLNAHQGNTSRLSPQSKRFSNDSPRIARRATLSGVAPASLSCFSRPREFTVITAQLTTGRVSPYRADR